MSTATGTPSDAHVGNQALMVDVSNLDAEDVAGKLITHAAHAGASDLFIVANEEHYAAQVRHLGIVRTVSLLTPEMGKKVMGYLRANSGMGQDGRQPTEGRWIYEGDDEEEIDAIDMRLSIIPTLYGEDAAIRLLSREGAMYQLPALGMTSQQMAAYEQMISNPSGLILITGPTGSGKTATLYASLLKLNDGEKKINTIEDPIEFAVDGLRQSQVNPDIKPPLGFADLLRAVLRQSPDVVMVGEIRDQVTAQTAVRAANSGMLVLATLHAPDAASAIQSMRAYDIPSHFLSTSLRGAVSQRLVRTLDVETRTEIDLGDDTGTFDDIKAMLKPGQGNKLYMPGPAPANQMTGYNGRTGVFEVMNVTQDVRNMIADGSPAREIHRQAVADGMLEFKQAALLKVATGLTTTEEVFRVIPSEQLLIDSY